MTIPDKDIPSIQDLQRSAGGKLNVYHFGTGKGDFVILGGTTTLEVAIVLFVIPVSLFHYEIHFKIVEKYLEIFPRV